MARRAVILCRMSQAKDDLGNNRQEAACRAYLSSRGAEVVAVLRDVISATRYRLNDRPGWITALEKVQSGQADMVCVYHVDRLTRDNRDLEDVIDTGVDVACASGEIDLSTDSGRTVARILTSIARGEVERKGARQRAANLQRAEAGRVGWTRRPYGYDKRGGRIVIVRAEAKELRDAARRILAERATVSSIVADLNRRGVPSGGARHGCEKPNQCTRSAQQCPEAIREARWTQTALTRLLLSPRHAGRAVSNGVDYGRGEWPAIFDPDTAERLHAKLTDPRRRTAPESLAVKYLLSGLLTCGVPGCGGKLYASPAASPTHKWMIYRCRTQHLGRRLDLVDAVVDALVIARMSRPDAARLLAPDVDVATLRATAADLRERRDALAAMVADRIMSPDAARAQAQRLTDQLAEVERQSDHAEGSAPFAPLIGANDVEAAWRAMSLGARRETVRVLFESLTVLPTRRGARFHPDQVAYTWRTA
ncbi:MAG TPA: recombinase family protein [Jatrophihabitans sp.]|nr:recombinase family protein [Jatrophihabitans sp.]